MSLAFIKFGGSLITDKNHEATVRPGILRRLAQELREVRAATPDLRLLLGHGSGSFGHWEASHYGTRRGVRSAEAWQGFAKVSAAASRLNRLVTDAFLAEGVPVLALQPSASARGEKGQLTALAVRPIRNALAHGLMPLIFGDVAFDVGWGGTIFSTEDLFVYLAEQLHPDRILLLGNAPGVLDSQQQVIPVITPTTYPEIEPFLRGSGGVDVTGGMADKVARMIALVRNMPGLRVWILSGRQAGNLRRALLDPENAPGTRIEAGLPA